MIGSMPTLSASEFVAVFNQSIEMIYPEVKIVGELANFRVSRGVWTYFDLKDEYASVKFFGTKSQLPGPLEEGLVLEVSGRPRLHPKYGFSVNVDEIKVSGEGSIKKAQDLLAQKLVKEGLFDESRKRLLPYAPERIGVVSSKDSAGLADFRKIIDARWGRVALEIIDVAVQGQDSPKQVAEAIQAFNQMANPPEVLVIIRGGGSADDLSAYSTEQVVRAVAGSRIPTLVAIGHETDVSLAELTADKRASTPSNAGELLVPDRSHEIAVLKAKSKELKGLILQKIQSEQNLLNASSERLGLLIENALAGAESWLAKQNEIVRLLDPKAPLEKGYALVWSKDKKHIRSSKIEGEKHLQVEFSDGMINVVVNDEV